MQIRISPINVNTIFERILNDLSFDKAIIDLHSKYATNFAYTFLL